MLWRINLLPKSPDPWCALTDVVKHLKETLWSLRLYRVFPAVINNKWAITWLLNRTIQKMWYKIVKLLVLCEKKLIEWGLWNNSWVKNLPVRPLAPRRKTPGQLYPTFRPPGQGQKFAIFIIYDIVYNYKGNQLSTH